MSEPDQAAILVVEDDENLRVGLEDNLVDEGYEVRAAASLAAAEALLTERRFDLAILDIMLPDGDGYELCRRLRARGLTLPVLMLTARTLEQDVVQGFDAGADDYLAKPYRLRELLARVRALLRRRAAPEPAAPEAPLGFAGFVLDPVARLCRGPGGARVELTRTEFDLLACLVRHRGRALRREELLAEAWEVVVEPRTVDNFVSSLRKKLGWDERSPFRIAAVRGIGYRLEVDGPK
ncbi:MAG: response regulator transcription factor [Polyangiaceae bacterium]|nr:response regulator transcription factor [Polyangiaceae bacterium]